MLLASVIQPRGPPCWFTLSIQLFYFDSKYEALALFAIWIVYLVDFDKYCQRCVFPPNVLREHSLFSRRISTILSANFMILVIFMFVVLHSEHCGRHSKKNSWICHWVVINTFHKFMCIVCFFKELCFKVKSVFFSKIFFLNNTGGILHSLNYFCCDSKLKSFLKLIVISSLVAWRVQQRNWGFLF